MNGELPSITSLIGGDINDIIEDNTIHIDISKDLGRELESILISFEIWIRQSLAAHKGHNCATELVAMEKLAILDELKTAILVAKRDKVLEAIAKAIVASREK